MFAFAFAFCVCVCVQLSACPVQNVAFETVGCCLFDGWCGGCPAGGFQRSVWCHELRLGLRLFNRCLRLAAFGQLRLKRAFGVCVWCALGCLLRCCVTVLLERAEKGLHWPRLFCTNATDCSQNCSQTAHKTAFLDEKSSFSTKKSSFSTKKQSLDGKQSNSRQPKNGVSTGRK